MDYFNNIIIAAFPKVHLKTVSLQETEMVTYINSHLERHGLNDWIRMEEIHDSSFSTFKGIMTEKYNSACDFYVVQATEYHTLIVCINSIEFKYLEDGIQAIWQELTRNLENVSLAGNSAAWAFTCSIISKEGLSSNGQHDIFHKLSLSKEDFNSKSIVNNGFEGWWDWNAGLMLLNKPVQLQKILYCFLIQSAKWEVTEKSYRKAIDLMGGLLDGTEKESLEGEQKLLELYSIHIFFNTVMEKNLVAYDQEDMSLHSLIEKGWEYDRLRQQATDLFGDIDKIVSFSNGIALKKSSYKTNKFLTYIGIIGFSGTVAALISTIDFSNSLFSTEVLRGIIIFLLTLVLVVFFTMLNKVTKPLNAGPRKKSGHPEVPVELKTSLKETSD